MQNKISLASDNWSGVHPLIMESIVNSNKSNTAPYGSDPWTAQAQALIQQNLGREGQVYILPTGTGANVFALKVACSDYNSVICSSIAHIHFQESGAAENIVGCKLLTIPHTNGKITPQEIKKKLNAERSFGKHTTFPNIISISQTTEIGTIYTLAELSELSKFCKSEDLLLHIDGSRIYNAAVGLSVSLNDIINAANPDLLSLGGTKNGLMCAEALVIFNPRLQKYSDYIQKQTLQLLSKMRFLSAQYLPFFTNDLWKSLATNANQKAKLISDIIAKFPELILSYPVESNQIFFQTPASWIPLIQERVSCYIWNQETNEIRLITAWDTQDADLAELEQVFISLQK